MAANCDQRYKRSSNYITRPADAIMTLFRYHNKRLLRDKRLVDLFDGALAQAGQKVRWDDVQAVQTIGEQLLGDGSQTIAWRQAGLCFGVQRINSHPDLLETKRSLVVNTLIKGVNQRTISELEESK
jgi:hypothetical protein